MGTFVVITLSARPELGRKIAEKYPPPLSYELSDRTWFVVAKGSAEAVCKTLGIVKGAGLQGTIVVRAEADYYGLASAVFWEWLSNSFEKTSDA